jgi:hypothetical protein
VPRARAAAISPPATSRDAALAKFCFALGWQAMLAKSTGNWLPGDEFEATRLHGVAR